MKPGCQQGDATMEGSRDQLIRVAPWHLWGWQSLFVPGFGPSHPKPFPFSFFSACPFLSLQGHWSLELGEVTLNH